MEIKDNPLVEVALRFQDGAQLGLRMDHPVPQVDAMAALGQFAAKVGTSLDFTLPRQPVELVAEAINAYHAARPNEDWTSHDLATAILNAVILGEQDGNANESD